MFRPNIYTQEVDMWSVGCILAELVLQEPLFRAGSELELLLRIFSVTGSPDKNLIAQYIDSGSEIEDPMVAFPSWKQRPFTEILTGNEDLDQELRR